MKGMVSPGDSVISDLTLEQGNSDNHFIKITFFYYYRSNIYSRQKTWKIQKYHK